MRSDPVADVASGQCLPLPLMQIHRRAQNATSALERSLAAYFLWEAGLKLLATVALVETAEGGSAPAPLADRLRNLARPSVGHWWEFVRLLVPPLADTGVPAFLRWREYLLEKPRGDCPRLAGLDAVLRELMDGKHGARATVQVGELFDRLVRFRNETFHGAAGQKGSGHYERLAPALLAGTVEVLDRLDVLAGRRLVHVAEVRKLTTGGWLVIRQDFSHGLGQPLPPLELAEGQVTRLPCPGRLYLQGDAPTDTARGLHPLLLFDLEADKVFFFNKRVHSHRAEYLCYVTGELVKRDELEQDQRALLTEALGSTAAEVGPAPEPAPAEPRSTRPSIGEYELRSRLGRGGMAVVYRAWQPSLAREVALKCLLRLGDAKAEARFAREIRAMGRVDHPNLVKVFTSGAEGDQWFIAMELVEGADLSAVCGQLATVADWPSAISTVWERQKHQEQPLETAADLEPVAEAPLPAVSAARLGRGHVERATEVVRQVTGAVQALHAAGVLHRDIKPGNIRLCAETGQAVLLDLGLAQLSDETEGRLTKTRQFVGTLRYASPEQIMAAKLDARADVYSLGATLWELLTLRPLFGVTEETPTPELMLKIQMTEPGSVRKHNPQVPADLEAVVLHCLEKDRARRYASAAELAADLGRWQRGEVVRARPVRSWERAWKWAKRNPMVAGLAAAVALTLLVGAMVSLGFALRLDQSNQELRDLNGKLRDAAQQAEQDAATQKQLRQDAEDKEKLAKQNKELADKRFVQALDTYRQMVGVMQAKLATRPGTQELRKALLADAIQGLAKLVREAEQTHGAEHVTFWAHATLGDVFLHIDGQTQNAAREYGHAHEIAKQRAVADPKDAEAQRDLSVSYNKLGDVSLQLGESQKALQYYQDGLKISQQRAAADPKDAQAQRDLYISYDRLGDVSLQLGESQKALQYYQDGLKISQQQAAADPTDAQAQRDLSVSYNKLGDVSLQLGVSQKALQYYQDSLKIRQQRAAADPKDAQAQRDLSVSYNKLGDVSLQLGESQKALQYYQDGLKISQQQAAADPKDAQAQRDLAISYDNLGDASRRLGESQQALQYYQDSLKISQEQAAADPKDAQAQRDLSVSYNKLGNVSLQLGESQKALLYFQDGLKIHLQRAAADPKDAQAQRDLSVSYERLGDVSLQSGESQEALQYYQDGLKIRQQRAAADPRDAEAQRDLSISYDKLGNVSLQLGESQKALQYYQDGQKIRQQRAAADPADVQAQTDLVASYFKLGTTEQQTYGFVRAQQWMREARAVLRKLDEDGKLKGTRFATWPRLVEDEIAFCAAADKAVVSLQGALTGPVNLVPRLLMVRIRFLVPKGDHVQAAEAAEKLAARAPVAAGDLYNAACGYALCLGLVTSGKEPADLPADARKLGDQYAAKALALLNQAKDKGFFRAKENVDNLKTVEDLKAMRAREDFRWFVAGLEQGG